MQPKQVNEAGGSLNDHVSAVRDAWWQKFKDEPGTSTWVADVFDDSAVVNMLQVDAPARAFRVPYTMDGDVVTFAPRDSWTPVRLAWEPVADGETAVNESVAGDAGEGRALMESASALVESTTGAPVAVLLVEGRSDNGNVYTAAALRSGVTAFTGARMYADHATLAERAARPERSVRDLVGKLGDAYVGKDPRTGKAALLAPLHVSESATWLKTLIREGIAGDLSISARGKGKTDTKGDFLVESFTPDAHTSVDFVTTAAAGGWAALAEAKPGLWADVTTDTLAQHRPDIVQALRESAAPATGGADMELVETLRAERDQALQESAMMFRRLRTAEAQAVLAHLTRGLPDALQKRVAQLTASARDLYATHGSQQTAQQLTEALTLTVQEERAYLASVTPNGTVFGLSGQGGVPSAEAMLKEAFTGLVPKGAEEIAARGRR